MVKKQYATPANSGPTEIQTVRPCSWLESDPKGNTRFVLGKTYTLQSTSKLNLKPSWRVFLNNRNWAVSSCVCKEVYQDAPPLAITIASLRFTRGCHPMVSWVEKTYKWWCGKTTVHLHIRIACRNQQKTSFYFWLGVIWKFISWQFLAGDLFWDGEQMTLSKAKMMVVGNLQRSDPPQPFATICSKMNAKITMHSLPPLIFCMLPRFSKILSTSSQPSLRGYQHSSLLRALGKGFRCQQSLRGRTVAGGMIFCTFCCKDLNKVGITTTTTTRTTTMFRMK